MCTPLHTHPPSPRTQGQTPPPRRVGLWAHVEALREAQVPSPVPRRWHLPVLSHDDYELAMMERLPDKPYDMPMLAYHYMMEQERSHQGEQIHSTLEAQLQQTVTEIMARDEALAGLSNQKVSALVNALVKDGRALKVPDGRKSTFCLA